ncbi:hypothetical protein [Kineosporia sp. R_H_3]|uniref:glycosyltransferase 87 family protein n=1 Tax=Kineosporia sp. R_H_3 TaxID=1961848 RepID=UPI000B4BB029|nr:hypothetical protein [Kineosporia sp. R_H_3]
MLIADPREVRPRQFVTVRSRYFWAAPVLLLGGTSALVVPLGLPYDEPSHWQYVLHVASTWTLPVVGADPSISHEGVQAPLTYLLYALVARVVQLLGGDQTTQFLASRALAVVWLWLCCTLLEHVVRRAAPNATSLAVRTGVGVTLLNPVVVAVGSSVQNDVPALAVAAAVFYVAFTPGRHVPVTTGLLIGLTLLTKVTMWPVAVVAGVFLLRRHGWRAATVTTGVATAVFGWWLVRNELLYGDLTGASAISRIGVEFPPLGWHGLATPVHLARSTVTFLWIPVEYYRNTITAPLWIEAVVVAATALVIVTGWRHLRSPGVEARALLASASIAVVTWAATDIWFEGSSFRIAYLALPAWAVAVAGACERRRIAGLLVGTTGLLTVWSLWSVVFL